MNQPIVFLHQDNTAKLAFPKLFCWTNYFGQESIEWNKKFKSCNVTIDNDEASILHYTKNEFFHNPLSVSDAISCLHGTSTFCPWRNIMQMYIAYF